MNRLLLVNPAPGGNRRGLGHADRWKTPPLGLAYVAAVTPPGWEIRIADEFLEPIPFDWQPDLVGITTYSCTAPKAYELSRAFLDKGSAVVLGGCHASVLPDEASRYATAVVAGEAEPIWPDVVGDFEKGHLQGVYQSECLPLVGWPQPRRDLFAAGYLMDVVQTSRGCPFSCEFCSVPVISGQKYRQRPVSEILDELEGIRSKALYFVDDNLIGGSHESAERALSLFEGMLRRRISKHWAAMTSIDVAGRPDVLQAAHRSGCRALFVGVESVLPNAVRKIGKTPNIKAGPEGVRRAIRAIHDSGIAVAAGIMFGHDEDERNVFEETVRFIKSAGIDILDMSILTPLPGTPLFKRLRTENRLLYDAFPEDWARYDLNQPVHRLKRLSARELEDGVRYVAAEVFNLVTMAASALMTSLRTRSVSAALFTYRVNKSTAGLYKHMGQ